MLGLGVSATSVDSTATAFTNEHSLELDGVDDFVDLGSSKTLRPDVGNGISLSLWCKWADVTTATSRIFSNSSDPTSSSYYGISCNKNAAGKLAMSTGDGGGRGSDDRKTAQTSSVVVENNTWHHIVFSWGGEAVSTFRIYVDGTAKAVSTSGSGGNNAYLNDVDTFIGKRVTSVAQFGNGFIDEVTFFNTALDAEQVTAIYNNRNPTDMSSPVSPGAGFQLGYWRMGDHLHGPAGFPRIINQTHGTTKHNGVMTNMTSADIVADAP